jgi:hypothetical protein
MCGTSHAQGNRKRASATATHTEVSVLTTLGSASASTAPPKKAHKNADQRDTPVAAIVATAIVATAIDSGATDEVNEEHAQQEEPQGPIRETAKHIAGGRLRMDVLMLQALRTFVHIMSFLGLCVSAL